MIPIRSLLLLVCLFTYSGAAWAQNQPQQGTRLRYWSATVPGGSFTVALDSITSVSMHTYVVDGSVRVTECVVADTSSLIARFYYMERFKVDTGTGLGNLMLDKVDEAANKVAERTGNASTLETAVVKSYPTTTHAKTVEYRLQSVKQVEELLTSVRDAWMRQRSDDFEIK